MASIVLKLRLIHDNEYVEPMVFDSYQALANYVSALEGSNTNDIESSKKPETPDTEVKEGKKFLQNELQEQVQEKATEVEEPTPISEDTDKKFLENDLKTAVAERKQQSKKSSFWDNLK